MNKNTIALALMSAKKMLEGAIKNLAATGIQIKKVEEVETEYNWSGNDCEVTMSVMEEYFCAKISNTEIGLGAGVIARKMIEAYIKYYFDNLQKEIEYIDLVKNEEDEVNGHE